MLRRQVHCQVAAHGAEGDALLSVVTCPQLAHDAVYSLCGAGNAWGGVVMVVWLVHATVHVLVIQL